MQVANATTTTTTTTATTATTTTEKKYLGGVIILASTVQSQPLQQQLYYNYNYPPAFIGDPALFRSFCCLFIIYLFIIRFIHTLNHSQ